tara:strand:- start:35 stop:343 length:309 start_codon:yes stop_codon:yes gene_type:complete
MRETNQSVKVTELKPGMLLRFIKPTGIKFIRDHKDYYWMDLHYFQDSAPDPVILYIGQREIPGKTYYGSYCNVREVMVNGRILWVMPGSWKHLEPIEISTSE